MRRSLLSLRLRANCSHAGTSLLDYFGESSALKCHATFALSEFLDKHDLRIPIFDDDLFIVGQERADILRCEGRGG
jgi:hypothetical protein